MRLRTEDTVALGRCTAGSMLWRVGGHLHLTVVVKARFALIDGQSMERTEAPRLIARDEHRGGMPTASLVRPCDAVPYLAHTDVLFVGAAHTPDPATARMRVRLAVYDGHQPVLDKSLDVFGARTAPLAAPAAFSSMPIEWERAPRGVDNPVGVMVGEGMPNLRSPGEGHGWPGLGPISRHWTPRRGLLDAAVATQLDDAVPTVPPAIDWRYFQAAPRDQQIRPMRGDEWVLLDGLCPGGGRVRSQLPSPHATVWVWGLGDGGRGGGPVALVADRMLVDGDAGTVTVSWRGAFPVQHETLLASLGVAAAVETVDERVDWTRELEAIDRARKGAIRTGLERSAPGATVAGDGALPFSGAVASLPRAAGADEDGEEGETIGVSFVPPGGAGLPFAPVDEEDLEGTIGIGQLRTGPAIPFAGGAPPPPPSDLDDEVGALGDTLGMAVPMPHSMAQGRTSAGPPPGASSLAEDDEEDEEDEEELESTIGVSLDQVARATAPFALASATAPRPALAPVEVPGAPWAPAEPSSVDDDLLDGTLGVATLFAVPAPVPLAVMARSTEAVPRFDQTGLASAVVPWMLGGRHGITVLVKGAFEIVSGRPAIAVDEPVPAIGDVWEDEDHEGGVRYPSDFAIDKPAADITLVGTVRAGGATEVEVELGFGDAFVRTLRVFGPRVLGRSARGDTMSDPLPFEELPLSLSHAYGGAGFEDNPLGRGYEDVPSGEPTEMPRIERPEALITSRADRPAPAGFGPVPMTWAPRRRLLGTFDEAWLRERWPYFPADFDLGFFHHAPPEQRVEAVVGDETFFHRGLADERVEGRLPGLRARCFVQRGLTAEGFTELPLALDTVHIDADAERLFLVWRGRLEVADELASDLTGLLLTTEDLDQRATLEEARIRFLVAQPAGRPAEAEADNDALPAGPMDAELDAAARARGAAVAVLDGPPTAPPPVAAPAPASPRARPGPEEPLAGRDWSGVDFSGADLAGRDLEGADLSGASLAGASLAGANLAGAVLRDADLSTADLRGACLDEADLAGADLSSANLTGATLRRADLGRVEAIAACCDGVIAPQSQWVGAQLRKVSFAGAELEAADFSEARIDFARFDGAKMAESRLYDAMGEEVSFRDAKLTELRAEGLMAPGAVLEGADATGAGFEAATLDRVRADGAVLRRATLVKATCASASFDCADLSESRCEGASFVSSRLRRANLMRAGLGAVDLSRADLSEANLFAAETWKARVETANLAGCHLAQTKLAPREPLQEPTS